MKQVPTALLLAAMLAGSAYASSHTGAPATMGDTKKDSAMAAPADMADGEIRKVDMDNKKITIKHGEIKNLDMPGMTMVFQVQDPALLNKAKAGDKVRFKAEKTGSTFVVTDIQPAK
ncbi:MAG: copper-binding protein [Polaromonas sp.]|uniref:copper-binding protein n=1 Tax=Polaromonas sp. TaxID=1869339 RepID=UPI002735C904|nr:copper-binding protein [Polaromonas sp.]MDP2818897.1 copper-binding protein [Polaromonas sp.]